MLACQPDLASFIQCTDCLWYNTLQPVQFMLERLDLIAIRWQPPTERTPISASSQRRTSFQRKTNIRLLNRQGRYSQVLVKEGKNDVVRWRRFSRYQLEDESQLFLDTKMVSYVRIFVFVFWFGWEGMQSNLLIDLRVIGDVRGLENWVIRVKT